MPCCGHCVLKTRFESSVMPGKLVKGKPTPIFSAAAVGTDIGRAGGAIVVGLIALDGVCVRDSLDGSDLFGQRALIVV